MFQEGGKGILELQHCNAATHRVRNVKNGDAQK